MAIDIEETIDAGNLELRGYLELRRKRIDYYKTLSKRIDYYKTLKRLWEEYGSHDGFVEWVEETYGFKVISDHAGNYTSDYTVVDEGKYTLFLLKYGK